MKLEQIIEKIPVKAVTGSLDIEVESLCLDSRNVEGAGLFFALKGVDADGHSFIGPALENGAVAVIAERSFPATTSATWIQVKDSREAMGQISANFYGNPSLEMPVVGITGTNGKTTTAFLVHHLMQATLRRAGLLGTIQYLIADRVVDAPHTTPEAPDLQAMLREMRDEDCRAAVMEVSSHGLAQHRVTGVEFDVGVFTNLSQDHLDYHGTMERYFESKKLLFAQMQNNTVKKGLAVINGDDRWCDRLLKMGIGSLDVVTFGQTSGNDLQASNIKYGFNGTTFSLSYKDRQFLVTVPLIGLFNVYNVLAALAAADGIGLNLREAIKNIAECPQVPGRLELVAGRQMNYRVYVDYAHTPDALVNVLKTLKELEPQRIITVFGCGGDRDKVKRPKMGAAAEEGSDFSILTSDNPRTEDPERILRDAEAGLQSDRYEVIADRRDAIERAINMAEERDIVLIAGKGHEAYQEIDGVRHEFDDRQTARNCIAARAEG